MGYISHSLSAGMTIVTTTGHGHPINPAIPSPPRPRFHRLEGKVRVELEVYNKTIDELNRPFSGIEPFIHLLMYSLEGEK